MSEIRVPAPAVRIERSQRAATITLERPPLNILDLATIAELDAALAQLATDEALQLVVVRGGGGRAFCAGVAVQDHTPDRVGAMLTRFHGAIRRLHALPAITLAAVDGHCLGGGMELALACDLVLASERSRFGQPEIQLGCYPPVAAALYPRRLGAARTTELLLTGRTLTCEEAERWGIVNWRVADAEFEPRLAAVSAELLGRSAEVSRLTKRAIRAGEEHEFLPALAEAERLYLEKLCRTEDIHEGIEAFLAKRPPVWRHR